MAKFAEKLTFFARLLYTFYKQKFSNVRQFLSIIFSQELQKSGKFGHWTLDQGLK